jgi:hypothetical protein
MRPWQQEDVDRVLLNADEVKAELDRMRAEGFDPYAAFQANLDAARSAFEEPSYFMMLVGLVIGTILLPFLPWVGVGIATGACLLRFSLLATFWMMQAMVVEDEGY